MLKLLFRNRVAVLATIAVPLILTYLFSFSLASNAKQTLYIADADKSGASKQIIDMIKSHKELIIITSTEATIKGKVDNEEISLGLVINKGFSDSLSPGGKLKIKIYQNYKSGDSAILEEVIDEEISTLDKVSLDSNYIKGESGLDKQDLSAKLIKDIKASSNITIIDKSLNSGDFHEDATIRLIGFLVMFIWYVVIQGFRILIDERENNTYNRLLTTPINYSKYLLSKILAIYIFGLLHVLAILYAGKLLMNISISSNLFEVVLIFAAYLLLLTSITSIIILFIKKHQNFTVSTAIIVTITGMLGGCFFPLELAPKYMQLISKLTPESWAIIALKEAIISNASITSEIIPLTVFIGVGTLLLVISSILVNRKVKFIN